MNFKNINQLLALFGDPDEEETSDSAGGAAG